MKYFWRYLVSLLLIIQSCSPAEDPAPSDTDYYPLSVGTYWIYAIDGVKYQSVNVSEEYHYELLVEVVDRFENAQGGETFVLHRSKRDSDSDPWVFDETWSTRIEAVRVVETQGNTSYVKLAFPLTKYRSWDSNEFNELEEDEFNVDEVNVSYELEDGTTFKHCLVVNQEDELNVIDEDTRLEVYANEVGLIYKKSATIHFADDAASIGLYIPKSGESYVQQLLDYGQQE